MVTETHNTTVTGRVDDKRPAILLVEDDERLSAVITEYLVQHGYRVGVEARGDTAPQRILAEQPKLVILDLMLPGMDGVDVCRGVRSGYHGPILMLTARDEDIEQVVGLEVGADDYVTKPVLPRVLLARIRALLRRTRTTSDQMPMPAEPLHFGALEIRPGSREASLGGAIIELTTIEFDLLLLLAENAGTVLSRDQIFRSLSGVEYDGLDRAVDIRISRLRKLLGDKPTSPSRIKTVRGKGYLFASTES